MTNPRLQVGFAALLFVFAGCGDGGRNTNVSYGDPSLSEADGGSESESLSLDFGPVIFGETRTQDVVLSNRGTGNLTLTKLAVLPSQPLNTFSVENLDGQEELGPSEFVTLRAHFAPPPEDSGSTQKYEDYFARIELRFAGARVGHDTQFIYLTGRGVDEPCGLDSELNFGKVSVGKTNQLGLEIRNPTTTDDTAYVSPITSSSGDHAAFRFADGFTSGAIPLPAQTSKNLVVEFTPTAQKSYLAYFRYQTSGECADHFVMVQGIGVP